MSKIESDKFKQNLMYAFNVSSVDNELDTPDHKLADMVIEICRMIRDSKNEKWRPIVGGVKELGDL